ncbi:MAG: pectate lyase, partial [Bacteroidota bacterium]|nr:pectate lyase [Bacteroidota bacterium]
IYNWGGNSTYGGEAMNVNIVNCYYKPGPATSKTERIISIDKNKIEGTEVYDKWGKFFIDGNFVEGSTRATEDNWTFGVYNQFHNSYGTVSDADKAAMRIGAPHPINNNVTTHPAVVAYDKVLSFSGASLKRDAVDKRVIENVKNKTFSFPGSNGSANGIIDTQSDAGGWPVLESAEYPASTADDGIPDEWKLQRKLDPAKSGANGRDLSTAYDNIEVYINSLVENIISQQNKTE